MAISEVVEKIEQLNFELRVEREVLARLEDILAPNKPIQLFSNDMEFRDKVVQAFLVTSCREQTIDNLVAIAEDEDSPLLRVVSKSTSLRSRFMALLNNNPRLFEKSSKGNWRLKIA